MVNTNICTRPVSLYSSGSFMSNTASPQLWTDIQTVSLTMGIQLNTAITLPQGKYRKQGSPILSLSLTKGILKTTFTIAIGIFKTPIVDRQQIFSRKLYNKSILSIYKCNYQPIINDMPLILFYMYQNCNIIGSYRPSPPQPS